MVHQGVEVGGAELPVAEGALVNASSKGAIVMAGLQPPEDVTSLGVEGLVVTVDVAVDVAALYLSRSTKDRAKNMESVATMM
jgi:mannitol-specific phosphotransferase system IIBC component